MRLLIIGRTGQVGGDLVRNAGDSHDVHVPSRDVLDVLDPESVRREIGSFRPHWVINTAAMVDVPLCDTEPMMAMRLNFEAVRDLASACREAGTALLHFSTDYVFDGGMAEPYTEDDITRPVQMYGMSKLAGECAALAVYPEGTAIVRSCGLYGRSGARSKGGNFVDKRIRDADSPGAMEMGSDQTVAPTYTDDLSRAVLDLISHGGKARGVFHLVNEGQCTWYEFTRAIYEIAGLNKEVIPVDRGGMGGGVHKPLYSVLGNNRAAKLGVRLPNWRDALRRYIEAGQGG